MSEVLSTVRQSFQHAVASLHGLDVHLPPSLLSGLHWLQRMSHAAPGSTLTQSLVVGALVGLAAYQGLKKRYRLPPGPFAWPLLGNLLYMNSKDEALYQMLDRWARENYGPIVSFYFGPLLCVTLNNEQVVKEALIQKGDVFAGRPFFHSTDVFTEGSKDIVMADYTPAWKLHRKIAMQALRHYMRGSHLEKVVHHVLSEAMDKMAAEPGSFDPLPYLSRIMFAVIDKICFGENKSIDNPELNRVRSLFDQLNENFGNGFWEDIVPLLRFWPTKKFRRMEELIGELFKYMYGNINRHRSSFSQDNIRDLTDSILLAQMEAQRTESSEVMAMFTDTHIGETIIDIFGAGVDTSRFTLNWALLYLAGHPEIQKRAQEEIDRVTGSRLPGVGDRSRLVYTEAVLRETLRLGTVAPTALPHKTLSDTTVGGYDVPQGTMVLVNQWALLHDPEVWEDPMTFNPDRFLDDKGELRKQDAWTPFSGGKRVCLGENVARPELLFILSCLLKRFSIRLPPDQPYDPSHQSLGFSIHIPKAFKITVTPRTGQNADQ